MVGNIEVPSLARPGEMERGLGDRLIRESFALDNNIPLDQLGEVYPQTTSYAYKGIPNYFAERARDLGEIRKRTRVYSDVVSNRQKLGQEIIRTYVRR